MTERSRTALGKKGFRGLGWKSGKLTKGKEANVGEGENKARRRCPGTGAGRGKTIKKNGMDSRAGKARKRGRK